MFDALMNVLGGLGNDQTGDIQSALQQIDGLSVASPSGSDDWKADVTSTTLLRAPDWVGLIVHSMGVWGAFETAAKLAACDVRTRYIALIAPVSPDWGQEAEEALLRMQKACGVKKMPVPVIRWFHAELDPLPAAKLFGIGEPVTIPGVTHNSICHDEKFIEQLIEDVREELAIALSGAGR